MEVASEWPGKTSSFVTVRDNLVYNNNASGLTIGGYDNKRGGTDNCTFVNNSFYNNDTKNTGEGEFQIQYFATNNVFKNNIVYAGAQNLFIYSYTTSSANPVDADYNLYYSAGELPPAPGPGTPPPAPDTPPTSPLRAKTRTPSSPTRSTSA